jgi:hypothetical protein
MFFLSSFIFQRLGFDVMVSQFGFTPASHESSSDSNSRESSSELHAVFVFEWNGNSH